MKLSDWRNEQGLSREKLAEMLGLKGGRMTVGRYEDGRLPERDVMERIIKLTDGKVMPNDWYTPQSEPSSLPKSSPPP